MMVAIALAAFAAITQVPEAQLATEQLGSDVIPAAFRGRWAPTRAECEGDQLLVKEITEDHVYGYEVEHKLLQISGVIYQTSPDGREAHSVMILTAWTGEGEVGIGRLRISRVGETLITSNPEAVDETEHWALTNVRCPDRPAR